ncbi:MAG: rod-binding protein [Candidatus Schekmanbacteria bacterium]|nr:rod-binding protein [Candidatus Schekmanbacteria bacterium]
MDVTLGGALDRLSALARSRAAETRGSGSPAKSAGQEPSQEEIAKSFESLFATALMRTMREAAFSGGTFGEGDYPEMFQEHLDQALGAQLAEKGKLGVARQLLERWGRAAEPGSSSEGNAPMSRMGRHREVAIKGQNDSEDTVRSNRSAGTEAGRGVSTHGSSAEQGADQ